MSLFRQFASLLLILASSALILGETKPIHPAAIVLNTQVEAWNKGDLDGFMKGYHEEVRFFSDNTIEEGAKKLSERYHKRYKADGKEMGKLTFCEVTVQSLSDSSAFVTGHWKVEKSKETLQGLFTLLMRKSGNDWKIVHDHTSAEPKK